jgi:hypothetical protein
VKGDALTGVDEMGSIMKLVNDPWIPGIQMLLFGAYLLWGWRRRRD